jgi:DNA-binding NtrC family response regulator
MAAAMSDGRHTLLVVDDEAEILASLLRTLRKESYLVLTTTSPQEALGLLENHRIDLLISDIDMPVMNGLELVARVRHAHPHVVRMLLTGAASLESAMRAINDGEVHRYLTKPWQSDELKATIRAALERLDELRRVASAERIVSARERLLAELEREHPGIREVRLDEGVYVLDSELLAPFLEERRSGGQTIADTSRTDVS